MCIYTYCHMPFCIHHKIVSKISPSVFKMGGTEGEQLHVAFFPLMAHGHMIPILDIARLFVSRGVRATIITTPLNVSVFSKAVNDVDPMCPEIHIEVFPFSAREVGLPEGCENLDHVFDSGLTLAPMFMKAADMLQDPLEQFLERTRPDCLVADMFFPWATDSAKKFNIPRLVFHGTCYFSLCVGEIIRRYEPYNNVSSDDEPLFIPHLPRDMHLTRLQLEDFWEKKQDDFRDKFIAIKESELKSYGVLVNSFYELEPDYAELFTKELGRKAWHVGPVSIHNKNMEKHECVTWLSSKISNSVVYVSFGSLANQLGPQLHEIAVALEASRQNFIWVVRKGDGKEEDWLPLGYEERMEGKGLIIRGWAPQVSILNHEAVGAFVTHCGWNSTLEGISAGLPMVTWPIFAEQFYNEKVVTHILKTGVPVGTKRWSPVPRAEDMVKRDDIEKAIIEVMEGEERRSRAAKLKEMAWNAVREGGSSYSDLSALLNELRSYRA